MSITHTEQSIENRIDVYRDQLSHIPHDDFDEWQRLMVEDVLTNMSEEQLDHFLAHKEFYGLEQLSSGMMRHALGFANYRKERVSN